MLIVLNSSSARHIKDQDVRFEETWGAAAGSEVQ